MAPTPSPGRQKIEKIDGKRTQNRKDVKYAPIFFFFKYKNMQKSAKNLNVTEREEKRQADKKLQDHKERYRKILETSGEDTEKGVFRENSTASVHYIAVTLVNQVYR